MHLFTRARVPDSCLPAIIVSGGQPADELEPWSECDILIENDRIVGVRTTTAKTGLTPPDDVAKTNLEGHLVWPGLVDAHTHLDKTFTWNRSPNPRGEFWDAIRVLREDAHKYWSPDDLYRRANTALERAWSHGTVALRTHLDSGPEVGADSHAVMNQLRDEWQDRISIQIVSMGGVRPTEEPSNTSSLELARDYGAAALGGFPRPGPELPRQLDRLLADARELGIGVDLHVDENGDPDSECLRATAEAVLRQEFPLPVTCGHNCSLAVQDDDRARETIALVKEAGINIIALPLCNQYLQGRRWTAEGRPLSPHWRGLTRLHELTEAGVKIASASDNVRDAFCAWGDYDMWEILIASIRIGHLDTRMALAPALVTTHPADFMGLPDHGRIAVGARADLVVATGRTFNEFLSQPNASRRLIHGDSFRSVESPGLQEPAGS